VVGAARRRGAQQALQIMLADNLPLVHADATLAEQAIGNIVNNAIQHTAPNSHLTIDAVATPTSVELRISDDGAGIDSADLPRLFERFTRSAAAVGASTDRGQGTGLGLAIAKGIMDAHGGAIRAESPIANGRGARFILTFPRQRSES
jgi:two-component system sensor histidine kinase KdpD